MSVGISKKGAQASRPGMICIKSVWHRLLLGRTGYRGFIIIIPNLLREVSVVKVLSIASRNIYWFLCICNAIIGSYLPIEGLKPACSGLGRSR